MDVLSPAQRSSIRRLARPPEKEPGDDGDVNVIPFLDIVTNVLLFVLATLPAVFTSTITMSAPATHLRGSAPSLDLSVVIVAEGLSLKTSGGNIAPGCDGVGPGMTLSKQAGVYPWTELRACAAKLQAAVPGSTSARIVADPGIDYATVIATMDALRHTDGGDPLFPDVTLGVIR